MVVMDLEWNRSYDKKRLDEILQIGAVRLERPGGPILSTFNIFVKPRVHKRFDPGARKLPDLQCSIDCDNDFPTAWAAFTAWCGDDREFAFWGPDDFGVIRQNCAYWGVDALEPEKVYNYQRAFSHACGATGNMMALWRVVEYLGIPDVFDYHNALNDAAYTALIGAWLRQEDLAFEPPKRVKRPRRRRRAAAAPSPESTEAKKPRRRRRRKKPKAEPAPSTEESTEE